MRRPPRPEFPPTPLDEMCGIALMALGLGLALLALHPAWMGSLAPLGETLSATLGSGFIVGAAGIVLVGAEAFTPHQALALPFLTMALAVLFVCMELLADLMGGGGGLVGASLRQAVAGAVGDPGAWILALAVMLTDLQWITRISLRGPTRLLAWPLRAAWRITRAGARAGARAGERAWQSYQECRVEAARRRAERAAEDAARRAANPDATQALADVPGAGPAQPERTRRDKPAAPSADETGAAVFPEYPRSAEPAPDEEHAPQPAPDAPDDGPRLDDDPTDSDFEIPGYEDEGGEERPPWGENGAPWGDRSEAGSPWGKHRAPWGEDGDPLDDAAEPPPQTAEEPVPENGAMQYQHEAAQLALFDVERQTRKPVEYRLPSLDLLASSSDVPPGDSAGGDYSRVIVDTLNSFGVATRIVNVERGPTVTRYELQPARGVKVSKITSLNNDIALALAAQSIRLEAPIPGKSAIGIEVPNARVDAVRLREILEAPTFAAGKGLMLALGKDISGRAVVADLLRMPHLLIAGATGSGKSVCLNTVIVSILYRATPQEVQLVMVDPKRVELSIFEGIPHLADTHPDPNARIVKDARTGTLVLKQATEIMNQRFEMLSQARVRNISEYNAKAATPMPYLVIIVDELAQLMQISARSVEGYLQELAQMGRAAGIHLILATQRPSVDVLTGTIKSNFPARIAFAVSAQVDSRTILDRGGAEKLLGRGDMLYSPTDSELRRVQGALITLEETERVISWWRAQEAPVNLTPLSLEAKAPDDLLKAGAGEGGDDEDLLREALRVIKDTRLASASNLQRKLQIGYPRAARLVDELELRGYLGPANGSKPRKILFLEGAE